VNLDKFWKKKKILFAFKRLHLPFQKWGICLICLHSATAMVMLLTNPQKTYHCWCFAWKVLLIAFHTFQCEITVLIIEHRSSGPRPVNLCFGLVNFSVFIWNYIKINSKIWFKPVNSTFHFEECNIATRIPFSYHKSTIVYIIYKYTCIIIM
jgi:hypothetical protein